MKKICIIGIISLFLMGCATIQPIDPALYDFTVETEDYNKAWDVLLKVLNERGEFITLANKSDGIIITGYNYKNPACSDGTSNAWISFRYRLNISVYNEQPVRIKIMPDVQLDYHGWQSARDDGTILNSIRQALSKKLTD